MGPDHCLSFYFMQLILSRLDRKMQFEKWAVIIFVRYIECKMSKELGRPYIHVHVITFLHMPFTCMYMWTRYKTCREI